MTKPDYLSLYNVERQSLIRTVQRLTPSQWDGPTLDEGWQVRDLVAHLITRKEGYARRVLLARGRAQCAIDAGVAEYRDQSPTELRHALSYVLRPRGYDKWLARLLIIELWIHHEDMIRPLHLSRRQQPETLQMLVRSLRLSKRYRGFRIVAHQPKFAVGPRDGKLVEGLAADIALALAGRPIGLEHLRGKGVLELRNVLKSL